MPGKTVSRPAHIFKLSRPESRNALDVATAKRLKAELTLAEKNKAGGFIIVSGTPEIFCAGGDLKAYAQMKTKTQGVQSNRQIREVLKSFARSSLVIMAVVEGAAVGGGCELALACDRIVAEPSARFAFRQSHLALTPGWGGGARLLRRVSAGRALDWLLSGRWVTAQEALQAGLVDELAPMGFGLQAALRFIEGLVQTPAAAPTVVRALKELVWSREASREEKLFNSLWNSPEHKTALLRAMGNPATKPL